MSPVQSVKNLGTWIDSNMSLQVNINNTCKAAYYYIFTNVKRIRKYFSNQATQTLVHALIIEPIDYCNSILYELPAKQIAKLQQLQNSAARLNLIPRFCHISLILCMLHWLPVEFRIHFKIIIITFKVIHGQAPVYLQELIRRKRDTI